MLIIDRRTLPEIPRPVYEFRAELVEDDCVRLSVMAGHNAPHRWTEVSILPPETFLSRVTYWLDGVGQLDRFDSDWIAVTSQVAERIAAWLKEN